LGRAGCAGKGHVQLKSVDVNGDEQRKGVEQVKRTQREEEAVDKRELPVSGKEREDRADDDDDDDDALLHHECGSEDEQNESGAGEGRARERGGRSGGGSS
jgi:hypothetical protein